MSGNSMTTLPHKDRLRPDEVADFYRVSTGTVRRWIREGKMKAKKVNGRFKIPYKEALKIEKTA